MTADRFREIVLSFDGVEERAHMGHPDFRAGGRIFASLHSKDQFGMVKLTPAEQRACIKENPETFSPSSGAWGRQGCTNIHLASASVARRARRGHARVAGDRVKPGNQSTEVTEEAEVTEVFRGRAFSPRFHAGQRSQRSSPRPPFPPFPRDPRVSVPGLAAGVITPRAAHRSR